MPIVSLLTHNAERGTHCGTHLMFAAAAALRHLSARDEWQPIETAPRDGRPLLLCRAIDADGAPIDWNDNPSTAGVFVQVASWREEEDWWGVYTSSIQEPLLHFTPTHWRALPPPPKGTEP